MQIFDRTNTTGYEFEVACNAYFIQCQGCIVISETAGLATVLKQVKTGWLRGTLLDLHMAYRLVHRFGLFTLLWQMFRIDYRFLWLRVAKGWKNGYLVL